MNLWIHFLVIKPYLQSQRSLPWMVFLCSWQISFLQAETSSLLPPQILSFYWRNRTSFHLPIRWYTNLQNADMKFSMNSSRFHETTVTASLQTVHRSRRTSNGFQNNKRKPHTYKVHHLCCPLILQFRIRSTSLAVWFAAAFVSCDPRHLED